ncbi:MAG: HDOD domain-containing protein [Candidatus Rokubacteria bacterium]|nr:HDOD domain-containing protein [Candidatus Rokubacteria bacterium]MBI3827861.1 HDOD domain-containing protein [Candidatus Rokubacteria bacterium]
MATLTERFVHDIEGFADLPSLPAVLGHLIATLGRIDASLPEIAEIIGQDPVLAGRVVRTANSAALAGKAPVATIRDALMRLGLLTVRRLALVVSLYSAVPLRTRHLEHKAFWRHSLGVAHAAQLLAMRAPERPDDAEPEQLFLAGLLHDMGLLVLDTHYSREFAAVREYATREGVPFCAAEVAALGADHGELSQLLVAHWGLPAALGIAIRSHHRLSLAPAAQRWNASVLHLADLLCSQEGLGDLEEGSAERVDESAFDALGLTPETLTPVADDIRAQVDSAAAFVIAG